MAHVTLFPSEHDFPSIDLGDIPEPIWTLPDVTCPKCGNQLWINGKYTTYLPPITLAAPVYIECIVCEFRYYATYTKEAKP